MKKVMMIIAIGWLTLFVGNTTQAEVLFRLPLEYNPGIFSWYDHNNTSTRMQRYDCAFGYNYDGHKGTDFKTPMHTRVLSGAIGSPYHFVNNCPDGKLDDVSQSCGGGFGNYVRVKHANGFVSIYAHLERLTPIIYGPYGCGTFLGYSGFSGRGDGPHLHFELWRDIARSAQYDFFGGWCSPAGYWVNQNGGNPTTQCQ